MNLSAKTLKITAFMAVSIINMSFSQQSITISGEDFIDASIYNDTRPGYEYLADQNYENHSRLSAWAWTHSGKNTYWRTLMYFDLSSIPIGSTINSATLYIYIVIQQSQAQVPLMAIVN